MSVDIAYADFFVTVHWSHCVVLNWVVVSRSAASAVEGLANGDEFAFGATPENLTALHARSYFVSPCT